MKKIAFKNHDTADDTFLFKVPIISSNLFLDPTVKTHYLVVATTVILMYVTGKTYLIRTLNVLYLESSSYGIDCFQNEDVDPFYATTVETFDK